MKLLVTILGIVPNIALAQGAGNSETVENVFIRQSADCLLRTLNETSGKCKLDVSIAGADSVLLASPEVATPYIANKFFEEIPNKNLTINVVDGEIVSVETAQGDRIVQKIDESR